jgi:CRISPR-associated protein Cas1
MLTGRLGLETARIPHIDRHGLIWLERGGLYVEDGCLRFNTAGSTTLLAGDYSIPFQTVSLILLGPGSTVSHDAFRLMARHGTGLVIVGTDGVRLIK